MDKQDLNKLPMSWQKTVGYFVGVWICGIWLAYGAQENANEPELGNSSATLSAPHFLSSFPPEIIQKTLEHLTPLELACLGQTSKAVYLISEATSLWQPLYQAGKSRLLPFLKAQEGFPLPFSSYKAALGVTVLLQRCFLTADFPDFSILEGMIRKAAPKGAYQVLLLARLYALAEDRGRYEIQAYKLLNYCPDRLVRAIYGGQGVFAKESKQKRFHLLECACQENLPEASMYKLSATVSGDLDERPPLERFEELYQSVLSGDQGCNDQTVCQALLNGKGFGQEDRSLEDRFRDLETLALKGRCRQAESMIMDALYQGTFYQDHLSEEERFLRLKAYTEADKHSFALYYVVSCLVEGKLGQEKRPEKMRFDDLLALIPQDSSMLNFASSAVANALIQGSLGQQEHSPAERFKVLEGLAFEEQERGDQNKEVGRRLVDIIIKGQELGQQEKSPIERFRYLEMLSARGLLAAQEAVVQILFQQLEVRSQFHLPLGYSQEERFALLEDYNQKEYAGSQSAMIKTIYSGDLGQKKKPADERCQQLKLYADLGDPLAQEHLDEVIDAGGFENSCGFSPWSKLLRRDSDEPPKFPVSHSLLLSLRSEKAIQDTVLYIKLLFHKM